MGENCVLVPYLRCHVLRYHEWMQNPDLLEATGSEPLSLSEEYEMQQSWQIDQEKCTFIVLDKTKCDLSLDPQHADNKKDHDDEEDIDFVQRNVSAMVGDVNLFLSEEDGDDHDHGEGDDNDDQRHCAKQQNGMDNNNNNNENVQRPRPKLQAEVDIMIAEEGARGKGIGKEATCLMIQYATDCLGIYRFFAKINARNTASRKLFRDCLGFSQGDYVECFDQYEYQLQRQQQRRRGSSHRTPNDSATTGAPSHHLRDAIDHVLNGQDLIYMVCCKAPQLEKDLGKNNDNTIKQSL